MAASVTTKRLYCIGSNSKGEFGDGNNKSFKTLTPMKWCKDINVINIFNGYDFTIYVTDNNQYYAAGNNTYNQCMRKVYEETKYDNKSKFKVGQKIVCKDSDNGIRYEATITKVQQIFKKRVYVTYDNFEESKGEWISSNQWEKRIFNPKIYCRKVTEIFTLKLKKTNATIKSIFCNPVYKSRHGYMLTHNNTLYKFGNQPDAITKSPFDYGNIKDVKCGEEYSLLLTMSGKVYGIGKS
eukprot:462707_1